MANSISKTTDGLVIFDDNTGKTPTDAYDGNASNVGGTWTYQTLSRDGDANNVAVRCDSNNAFDYLSYRTYAAAKQVVGCWIYRNSTASNFISGQVYVSTGDAYANSLTGGYRGDTTVEEVFNNNTRQLGLWDATIFNQKWTYAKGLFGVRSSTDAWHIFFKESDKTTCALMDGNSNFTVSSSHWSGIHARTSNQTMFFDNWSISKDVILTVAGLASGMVVNLLDASDVILKSKSATGTSLTFDTTYDILPYSAKFQIIGTDGTERLKTTLQTNIYGGDTWTYDGDTAGASGGGAINVMNNNM